jgi:hypothetical protein
LGPPPCLQLANPPRGWVAEGRIVSRHSVGRRVGQAQGRRRDRLGPLTGTQGPGLTGRGGILEHAWGGAFLSAPPRRLLGPVTREGRGEGHSCRDRGMRDRARKTRERKHMPSNPNQSYQTTATGIVPADPAFGRCRALRVDVPFTDHRMSNPGSTCLQHLTASGQSCQFRPCSFLAYYGALLAPSPGRIQRSPPPSPRVSPYPRRDDDGRQCLIK